VVAKTHDYQLTGDADDLALVRADTLPENGRYGDDSGGCRINRTCLDCPRARCVLDDEHSGQFRTLDRNFDMVRMRASGRAVNYIAGWWGVSGRTVHRVLLAHKDGSLDLQREARDQEIPMPPLRFRPVDWDDEALVPTDTTANYLGGFGFAGL
jgi:hypothetical protein